MSEIIHISEDDMSLLVLEDSALEQQPLSSLKASGFRQVPVEMHSDPLVLLKIPKYVLEEKHSILNDRTEVSTESSEPQNDLQKESSIFNWLIECWQGLPTALKFGSLVAVGSGAILISGGSAAGLLQVGGGCLICWVGDRLLQQLTSQK